MTGSTTEVFGGWPADATAFLTEIAADNTAEFWAAHRDRYAESVLPPLRALAAELAAEFGPLRIFRPYRDRRFRPDADPYRVDAGVIGANPAGTVRAMLLSGTGLAVEVGRFAFDGPALQAYRTAVAEGCAAELCGIVRGGGSTEPGDAGVALAALLDELAGGHGLALDATRRLTGVPRGVSRAHPRIELLRLRGLLVRRVWPAGEWVGTREPLHRVQAAWRAAEPLVRWLDQHARVAVPPGEPHVRR